MIIDFKINTDINIDELWEQSDYLDAFELSSENDRAFILVSAVALEDKIENILKLLLPSIKTLADNKEFTFSFKINLLKSFELYNPKLIEYIHLVRKIRNEFAHNLSISDFENISSRTLTHIDQCLKSLESKRTCEKVREKIEVIVKWLFWELIALEPYSKKLREIMDSRETVEKLMSIAKEK